MSQVGAAVSFPPKPPRHCQCDPNCPNPPLPKYPFCQKHKNCPIRSPLSGYEPLYNPGEYNNRKSIRHSHNCYAYSMNVKDKKKIKECAEQNKCSFHVPGKKQGHKNFDGNLGKTCSDVVMRTMADIPRAYLTDFSTQCNPGFSKIFALVDEKNDLHYGRQDKRKTRGFSHKPGGWAVTDRDSEGSLIIRPDLATWHYPPENKDDTGLYYKFCNYMCVPRDKEPQLLGGFNGTKG